MPRKRPNRRCPAFSLEGRQSCLFSPRPILPAPQLVVTDLPPAQPPDPAPAVTPVPSLFASINQHRFTHATLPNRSSISEPKIPVAVPLCPVRPPEEILAGIIRSDIQAQSAVDPLQRPAPLLKLSNPAQGPSQTDTLILEGKHTLLPEPADLPDPTATPANVTLPGTTSLSGTYTTTLSTTMCHLFTVDGYPSHPTLLFLFTSLLLGLSPNSIRLTTTLGPRNLHGYHQKHHRH